MRAKAVVYLNNEQIIICMDLSNFFVSHRLGTGKRLPSLTFRFMQLLQPNPLRYEYYKSILGIPKEDSIALYFSSAGVLYSAILAGNFLLSTRFLSIAQRISQTQRGCNHLICIECKTELLPQYPRLSPFARYCLVIPLFYLPQILSSLLGV